MVAKYTFSNKLNICMHLHLHFSGYVPAEENIVDEITSADDDDEEEETGNEHKPEINDSSLRTEMESDFELESPEIDDQDQDQDDEMEDASSGAADEEDDPDDVHWQIAKGICVLWWMFHKSSSLEVWNCLKKFRILNIVKIMLNNSKHRWCAN